MNHIWSTSTDAGGARVPGSGWLGRRGAAGRRRASRTTLRICTYNIMNGGGSRWPAQLEVLASLDLDVLGIQEAKYWDRDGCSRMFDTGEALAMQARLALSRSHGCHLVLLYRWPRVRCLRFTPDISCGSFHHAATRALLSVDGVGQPLCVIHTHLDPFSPQDRLAEAGWLTEYAAPDSLSVIIGDLNTIGAVDEEPDDWSRIPAHLQSRHRIAVPDGGYGPVDRQAIHALTQAGFVDPPVLLGTAVARTAGHWPGSEPWDHRSDHVLLSPRIAPCVRSHEVADTTETQRLSDHLPVITTLDLAQL